MPISSLIDEQRPRDTILGELVGRIERGELEPGTKLLATNHLAKHYGVATKTAQSAVAELARRGYVTRQAGRGTFVSRRKRDGLADSTQPVIGLMVSCRGHIWGEFTATMAKGLGELAMQAVIIDSANLPDEIVELTPELEALIQARPPVVVVSYNHQAAFIRNQLPDTRIICLEARDELGLDCDRVIPDFARIGDMAAAHLIEQGYRRPALLGLQKSAENGHCLRPDDHEVLTGLNRRLVASGLTPALELDAQIGEPGLKDIPDICQHGPDRPDVVVCALPHRAMELVKALRLRGMNLPADIGVIVCSETPHCEALDLTAIDRNYEQIARSCLDLIAARTQAAPDAAEVRHYLTRPRLLLRHSAPGQARA